MEKQVRKIFKRINKCMICQQNVSMNIKIGKKYICYNCLIKISDIINITISTTHELLRRLNPELLDDIKKIIELGKTEIDIRKSIKDKMKDKYNVNIEFF